MRRVLIAGLLAVACAFLSWTVTVIAGDLYISGPLDGVYYSDGKVIVESGTTVAAGKDVIVASTSGVVIRPGFRVQQGGVFVTSLVDTTDTDGDGLPDWWENAFWGNLSQVKHDDSDGDGFSNYMEYVFNTSPVSSSSQPPPASSYADIDRGTQPDEQQGGTGLVSNSIRLTSGNVMESREDLSFPSPNSLGLSFRVWYNSSSNAEGSLGYGWSHTYEGSLQQDFRLGNRDFLKITDETGRAAYFIQSSPGYHEGVLGERTYVLDDASGVSVWYRLDGSLYAFSPAGKLSWKEDEKGNRQEMGYQGGALTTVTDLASGRSLAFSYYGSGLLEKVTGPITTAVPDGVWVTYNYDGNRNFSSVTYADGSGFTYSYGDASDVHNLTMKQDKSPNQVVLAAWTYDGSDRASTYSTVGGSGVTLAYLGGGSQTGVTDVYGQFRSYDMVEINGRNRLSTWNGTGSPRYDSSNVAAWQYDADMNLSQIEYMSGLTVQYLNYEFRGLPGTVIYAQGMLEERVITYTYHPHMNRPLTRTEASVLGAGSKITIWDYDSDYNSVPNENPGMLLRRVVEKGFTSDSSVNIVPYEYVTPLNYNARGQILSIDGPRSGNGDTTSFAYHETTGDLLTITRPVIGNSTLSAYDAAGRPGTITDENNQSRTFLYDCRGRVTHITDNSDLRFTEIVYDLAGQPQAVTDPDEVTQSFVYDATYGRLSRIVDAEGSYIQYQYDSQGNRVEMSKHESSGMRTSRKRWSYQHPAVPGKLWKEINADDSYTEYDYDGSGNVNWVRNPENFITTNTYDYLNRVIRVTQPGSVVIDYGYDRHGNLASVTDAEDHQTTYIYDDMGRLVETGSPDTGTVSYAYDEAGNLTNKIDAKEINVVYSYDLLNRQTGIQFPDSAQNIGYTYDTGTNGKGHLTGVTDPSGTMSFGYDARGRLTQRTTNIEGHPYPFSQTYTPWNKVMSVTYPSGRTMNYTRDSLKRMQGLSTTYNSNTVTLVSGMTHKPFGGPKGMITGVSGVVNNQAGECDCITVANPGSMMEQQYTYDRNRNLITVVAPNTPQYNQTFTYDSLNRLGTAEGRYGSISYTYDKVGNRLTETVNSQTDNYTYFSNTNRLHEITGANPLTYTYDANGNITGMGTKTLVYNQDNRLVQVTENEATIGAYTYNGKGERVKKVAGSKTTIYHYDFDGKLIAESTLAGIMLKEYLYMGQIRMAMVDVAPQKFSYYLNDRLGTPQMMTDNTGKVVWEGMYKPFGEASVHPQSTVVNNIRFPGQYYDSETGLHYNYHRYYQPRTGRYVTPDPIGLLGGINLYGYASFNPINRTDRRGLSTVAVGAGIGFVFGGPPGAAIGATLGIIGGAALGKVIWEYWVANEDNADKGEGCEDEDADKKEEKWLTTDSTSEEKRLAEEAKKIPPEEERELRDKGWVPIDEVGPGTPIIGNRNYPGWVKFPGGQKTWPQPEW